MNDVIEQFPFEADYTPPTEMWYRWLRDCEKELPNPAPDYAKRLWRIYI